MAKVYVVLEKGWEYNDESYCGGEGDSYEKPQKAFKTKAKAEAYLAELNKKKAETLFSDFSYENLLNFEYGSYRSFFTDSKRAEEILAIDDLYSYRFSQLTREQKDELTSLLAGFYTIAEVEVK